jgi:glutamyl-tRNA synthetase
MTVRVRFAPSPTGYLHIGGARTALFNWLFARKMKGTFLLRIEDTDEARSTDESVNAILKSLEWLNLNWDEGPQTREDHSVKGNFGPYFQMVRKEQGLYQKYIDQLIAAGQAYKCYCTPEELDAMRSRQTALKQNPRYDGACRCLNQEQRAQKENEGRTAVIRFAMPQAGSVQVDDIIRGPVTFENNQLDDFVLMKANGVPTYNFACVIDDHLMEISHVIRGDDHLSNTPRQIHLYKTLGWGLPKFAHLSMILGPDGTRLSKRHGHTSVMEYRNEGYLPEALINYLALLGWSTEDSQQLFVLNDLIEKFSLERCSKSPAVFDPQKLHWMNGEYIRNLSHEQLINRFKFWLRHNTSGLPYASWDEKVMEQAVTMEHDKAKTLKDIPSLIDIFFLDKVEYVPEAVEKVFKVASAKDVLLKVVERLPAQDFAPEALEAFARALAVELGVGNGKVFHPIRVAISGRTNGPSLFHMMELMGKEKVIRRINETLEKFFK